MPFGCIAVITDRTLDHGRRLSVSEDSGVPARRSTPGGTPVGSLADIRDVRRRCAFQQTRRTRKFGGVGSVTVDAVEIVSGGVNVGDEIVVVGTDVFENAQPVRIAE